VSNIGRYWRARFLTALLPMLACTPAFAADTPASLNLRQLIELARRDNKDLQAARFAVDIGQAKLQQAGLRSNPRLGFSGRSDVLFGNDGEHSASLAISQDFPIAGRLLREKDVARVDIALAEVEVAEAERRLAGDVAADVYRLIVVDRRIAAQADLATLESQLLDTARQRFKAAEVSELDVNSVQLDLQASVQEKTALEGQREQLLATLNGRIGRAGSSTLTVAEPAPGFDPLPPLPRMQQLALQRRPDLQGALLLVDRAQAERALAHASRWQDWTLAVELAQDKQVIDGAPPQGNSHSLGLSVAIPLPLFNKGQGRVAETEAYESQAQEHVEALRLSIGNEVASAHAEATRLQSSLQQYEQELLPISASNVKLAQQGYRQGLIPIFDVIQFQRQQAQLHESSLATLDQFLQALVRLHTAADDYGAINR
jgi:cobalt-zinc-cadmium efflux system outer membrane protein